MGPGAGSRYSPPDGPLHPEWRTPETTESLRRLEIGNEIYESFNTGYSDESLNGYANPEARNGGDPPWFGKPASSAKDYADRAIEYIDRVLATLLERSAVAGVVVHQYIIDDGQTAHGWDSAPRFRVRRWRIG